MQIQQRVKISLIALATFAVAHFSRELVFGMPWYERLYDGLPTWAQYLEQPVRWLLCCFAGLYAAHRMSPWAAFDELGLRGPVGVAFVFGLVTTVPMWLPSLVVGRLNPDINVLWLVFSSSVWPLAEEILYRGYTFRQLYRRADWGLWTAAGLSGLVFGLVHLASSAVQQQSAAGQLGTVAVIATMGVAAAWVFTRWDDNVWILVSLHGFMNLWWDGFDMADNPLGGWGANLMRGLVVILVIVATLNRHRLGKWFSPPAGAPADA